MSLQTALSGLNGAQTGLDTVSNDLANASTTAFKSQTAEFKDVYPSGESNVPGIGVATSSMDTDFSQGATVATGNPFDAAIQGNGYFVTSQNGTQQYTRDGSFELSPSGELVTAATGSQVMGIQSTGALGPITINTGAVPAQPTTTSALAFNLNSGTSMASITTPFSPATATSYAATYPVTAYDSLGNASTVQLYFVPTTPTTAGNPPDYAVYAIPQSPPATATAAPYTPIATMQFNQNGTLVPGAGVSTGTLPITWTNGAAPSNIAFTFTGTTLAAQSFAVAANATNGAPPGNYTGTTISTTGELTSTYSNGQTVNSGTLAIANFINQEGLTPISGNLYASSSTSGQPLITAPGTGQAGQVSGGELEQSNASTSALLVSLIQYQQAYQANTSVIQTEQQDSTRLTQI